MQHMKRLVDEAILSRNLEVNYWKQFSSWCNLFQGNEWVIKGGHYERLYPKINGNTIFVPAIHVYDVHDKRHWTTTSTHSNGDGHTSTKTHHHYRVKGRLLTTSALSLCCGIFEARALQVGSRFFLSRTKGPLKATTAFSKIVNQKHKRSHLTEVLVDKEMLREFLCYVIEVNLAGGYSTCTVAETHGNWYAIRNWTCLGKETTRSTLTEHKSGRYEYDKTIPSHFRGCMFDAGGTSPVQPYIKTVRTPLPGTFFRVHSAEEIVVECSKKGWALNLQTPDVERIDTRVNVLFQRPLAGSSLLLIPRISKTYCPEIVEAEYEVEGLQPKVVLGEGTPLSILGCSVEQPDGHSHVRVKKSFRKFWNEQMKLTSKKKTILLPYLEEARDHRHSAGWKGTYKVYHIRLTFFLDDQWYWLDSLQKAPIKPNYSKRIRYLELI